MRNAGLHHLFESLFSIFAADAKRAFHLQTGIMHCLSL